jgi:coenzyme Q-binding protein COQ10
MLSKIQNRILGNHISIRRLRFINDYKFISFNFQKPELCVSYRERKILGYPKEYIFDLVKDVQHYHYFVPWCLKSEIITSPSDGNNNNKQLEKKLNLELPESFKARLEVGYPPVKESYISHVTLIKPKIVKTVAIKTTFFEYINAEWKFHSYDHLTNKIVLKDDKKYDCCVVEFFVTFKFRSNIYSQFSSLFLDNIFKKMVSAFIKRANDLYGGKNSLFFILKLFFLFY